MGFGDASSKDKKASAAKAKASAAAQAAEDASWAETDKGLNKKASRAADKDAKADAKLAAKAELKALEEAEDKANSTMKGANKGSSKMTQAQIAQKQALMAAMSKAAAPKKKLNKSVSVDAEKIEANTNRDKEVAEGSGLDAALSALEGDATAPAKMTYKQFEDLQLPGIREENPGLKLQQAKDRCFKMWERAPENPKNQEK